MRTVTGRTDHVVVVGAGLAGLSAALHLLDE
jgi:phytoene desaturase